MDDNKEVPTVDLTNLPAFGANPPVITNIEETPKKQPITTETPKQIAYPNLNNGAPEGNTNGEKFRTLEERAAFLEAYCNHVRKGFSDESFNFRGSGVKTFKNYVERYPVEFPTDLIEEAQAARMMFWEQIGMSGTMGLPITVKDKNGNEIQSKGKFNDRSWIFNMQNRFKWRIQTDVTTDGEKLETPVIYIPQEESE